VVGTFADRVQKRALSQGLFLFQAVALMALISAEHPATVLGSAFLFGLTIGNVYMMQSLLDRSRMRSAEGTRAGGVLAPRDVTPSTPAHCTRCLVNR
jgi:predicted MFS family arabinose efflux permease